MCEGGIGEFSESFAVEVQGRQWCVMSPWLFNIFVDGCVKETKWKVVNVAAKLRCKCKCKCCNLPLCG